MAPLAPIQTVQGYFQPAQQGNLSKNLLAGMEQASRTQYRNQATETDQQRLKLEQEKYDAEKAAKQEEMAKGVLDDAMALVNTSDPAAFQQTLGSQIPIIEKQIRKMFPEGLSPVVLGGMENLKQMSELTDQKQLDVARTSVQQYQEKMGIKVKQTPEQIEKEAYGRKAGQLRAESEYPDAGESSDLAQIMKERDALPEGSPDRAIYDNYIQMKSTRAPQRDPSPYYQYVGRDDNGNPMTFDTRTREFQSDDTVGVINPKPSNAPSGEQKDAERFNMLATNIKVAHDYYNPAWVGPVAGTVQKKAGEYINLPEKQQRFYASLDSLGNILLYLRSGAQINENEYKRLKKELPSARYSDTKFVANYNNFMDQLEDILMVKGPSLKRRGIDAKALLNRLPPKMGEELQAQQKERAEPEQTIQTAEEYLNSLGMGAE